MKSSGIKILATVFARSFGRELLHEQGRATGLSSRGGPVRVSKRAHRPENERSGRRSAVRLLLVGCAAGSVAGRTRELEDHPHEQSVFLLELTTSGAELELTKPLRGAVAAGEHAD